LPAGLAAERVLRHSPRARQVSDNVTSVVITNSWHWIMEEQPGHAVKIIAVLLIKKPAANR
jgi:hypothetical protein